MGGVKAILKPVIPKFALDAYRHLQLARMHRRNRNRSAEAVFSEIYANNLWGGDIGTYSSGSGSRDAVVVEAYVECMRRELERLGSRSMTAVDLGCGDYRIGGQLAPSCGRYIGVDVVRELVAHNNAKFSSEFVSFQHLDIVDADLPDGDICFVRQVLQHLSNDQIAKVLPKLGKFKWCFITEHHPAARRLLHRNMDKPHGKDIRVDHGSGVFLDWPPFSLDPGALRLLLEVPASTDQEDPDSGVIRTFVVESAATS